MTIHPGRAVLSALLVCGVTWGADAPALPKGYALLSDTPAAQYDLRLVVQGEKPVTLAFAQQDAAKGYRLTLGADGAVLSRVNGETVKLAEFGNPYQGVAPHQVVVRRRESQLYVAVDGRFLLDALDGTFHAGVAALLPTEGVKVSLAENGYQPVEDLYFTDDFMRTKDQQQLGVWRHVSGKWRFYSVLETNEKADLRLSVNPFSLGLDSDGTTPSAVVTGHPFWCDYEYSASFRSRGGGWAGLMFGYRGEGDYYLLRADVREQALLPRLIELVRVKGGKETVLNSGSALLSAEQWYRLGVHLRGARIQCLLDGGVIFDRVDSESLGGPVGLWTAGKTETLFDDVRCATGYDWPLDRLHELRRNGRIVKGEWRFDAAGGRTIDNDPAPRQVVCSDKEPALFVWGDPEGASYRLDANVKAASAGRVGMVFGYRDAEHYLTVEWDPENGKLGLYRINGGAPELLGLVRDKLAPGEAHNIALDLLTPNHVQVRRDGLLRMRAPLAEVPPGRLGLAANGTSVVFSDLQMRQVVPEDTEVQVDNSNFADDPFMLHWASSLADWFPKGTPQSEANGQQIYWHKGDFYRSYRLELPAKGSFSVLLNATEEKWLPPADAVVKDAAFKIDTVADKQFEGDGYTLHLVGGGTAGAKLFLFRQGARLLTAPVPADLDTLTVAHDGGVTWVEGNGLDLLVYHDAEPLTGPRVALRVAGNDVLYHVKCRREGIIDEVFDKAPAAWVQQGQWVITNRFSCTPTWSHMTALERGGLGGIWHKDAFPGNVTIEYYAGMRMQSDYAMIYPRCGDFNCTFAAQPFSLETGISLIPAAWDKGWTGVWTRYAQGHSTIVETDRPLVPRTREDSGQRYIPVPYISAGRDVHGAWYYVKSRYVNGKLEGYFDNEKVLSGEAPKADGDRVAFWTQDDQIVLARVRITYENKTIPNRLVDRDPVAPQPDTPSPLLLTTNAAPGIAFDFDESTQGWAPRDRFRDVTVQPAKEGERRFLLVTNQLPGGSFEAAMPLASAGGIDSLSLDKAAVLRFDYKLPAETKIDLYLTANGKQYSIPLTGNAEDTPLIPVLLNAGGLTADGQWHTARLPLGAALRQTFGKTTVALTDLRFGNKHQGYLLAGFGGNPTGAWYALDNFAIVPEVGAGVALAPVIKVLPKAGVAPPAIKTVRAVLDRSPQTVPSDDSVGANPPTPAESGVYYLHAQATLEDGTVTAPAHLPLLVVTAPQPLKPLADNAAWDGGPLSFAFGDSAPTDASLTIGDKTLTFEQAAHIDAAQKRLSLDPAAAGLTFTDGQKVAFKLTAAYASGGKEEQSFERVFALAQDKTPPAPPVISGGTLYYDGNRPGIPFEPAYPQYTNVSVDPSESPDGLSPAFRVTNLVPAGQMQLNLAKESVDLAACPVLMFDYKVTQPVRTDFRLYTAGNYFSVTFSDSAGPYLPLGTIPNVARDGKWHRAEINLQRPIAGAVPFTARMYDLRQLIAMEEGYSGEAPGASYWLDNLRLVRVASGAGVRLAWQAADPSGIDKYRYVFSEKEDAEPATELPGTQTSESFKPGKDGLLWFSLQACDKAGNWGKPTRMPILVDSTPPVFGAPTPAPGALGTWNVTVPVEGCDIADLDPAALKFTAGDKTVPVTDGNVVYSPAQKKLVWDWCRATKQFSGRVADGTAIKLGVAGSDAAGNAAAPGSWDYAVSYAADKQPPLAPDVQVPSQPLRNLETFSDTLGNLDNGSGSYRSPVQKVIDPERQDACAQITTTGSGVYLTYGATDLNKHPYLSFDYKMGPNVVLHLMLYCANGTYYSVALNGKDRTYTQIGAAAVAADGKWHTAVIDLGSMVKQNLPSLNAPHIQHIVLSEYGSSGGQTYWLDNVAGFGPMGKDVAASWVAYDATGIQGASAALTPGLDGAEPAALTADQTSATLTAPQAGTFLLQVRAQDGAGNWGGTARRVIVVQ